MITYVNKSNTAAYADLYAKVTELLMTHNDDNEYCNIGYGVKTPESVGTLTAEEYTPGRYYYEAQVNKVDATTGEELNELIDSYVLDTAATVTEGREYFNCDAISSLEELYFWLHEVALLAPKYTRLPLDEDVFEIDANARTITVPDNFKKNGISVQGDEISEIVYFKIRRYYDMIDLSTRNVLIEWEAADKTTGVSLPYIVDVESAPGYIIFGWPLSSKITAAAGTVTFGVRFYTYNQQGGNSPITYSLSTLKQTVAVKPGMNYDIAKIIREAQAVDDRASFIQDRIIDSTLADGSNTASEPQFILKLPTYVNLTLVNGFYNGNIDVFSQAIVEDAGDLKYEWKKYEMKEELDEYGQHAVGDLQPIEAEEYFKVTTDTTDVDGKLYYMKQGEKYILTTIAEHADAEDDTVIYEKMSKAVFDSVGYYCVVARNRVRNARTEVYDPTSTISDGYEVTKHYCIVAWPEKPVLAEGNELPEAGIVANGTPVALQAKAEAPIQATMKNQAGVNDKVQGVLTYQWQKADVVEMNAVLADATLTEAEKKVAIEELFEDIEGATEKTYNVTAAYESIEVDGVTVNAPIVEDDILDGDGYYRVVTINNLNKKTESITSEVYTRVTHAPSAPVIEVVDNNVVLTVGVQDDDTAKLNVTIDTDAHEQRTAADKITYQWYRHQKRNNSSQTIEEDIQNADAGLYTPNESEDTKLETDANGANYVPAVGGYYYFCMVTNTYNGQSVSKCSPFINVNSGATAV